MMTSSTRNKWISAAAVIVILAVWKIVSLYYNSNVILPSPEDTFLSLCKLVVDKNFLAVVGTTVLRGLIGFAIAGVLGVVIGIFAGLYSGFKAFINPFIVIIRSIPVIAVTLLALIWFVPNAVPVFIGLLTMFPMVCTNVISGIESVNKNLVEMAKFYRVNKIKVICELYIPAIAPFIFSGLSNAFGIGWRAIIIGEVLSQPKYGIGAMMQMSQTYLKVDVLIAWTVVAVLLSYLFESIIRIIERKTIKWRS